MKPKADQGPGKYDKECVAALASSEAQACVLIVLGCKHGSGFSSNSVSPDIHDRLPGLLREIADQIEGVS